MTKIRGVKIVSLVVVLAAALAALPGIGSAREQKGCRAGVLHRVGTDTAAFAAVVRGKTKAYRHPAGHALATFGKLNQNGYPTTFSIVGAVVDGRCQAKWYRVKLPMRPNGVVGYVKPHAVTVSKVTARIEVDLSARTLTFFKRGKRVLRTSVAVGSPSTPTPIGRFYVNQRLVPTDPSGPYGPAALGVSAFSDVLTGWAQGGPIGIHGTNADWSIGRAVSNGCIRVPNATLKRLFARSPGGTPVVIHP
jgi:lipoprotein-anchoring transpeptidase ErfK/SrfK